MPFKNRADRLRYISKYNGSYYKKNRAKILVQKKLYYSLNRRGVQSKIAARRRGDEAKAAANTRAWYAANTEKAKLAALRVRLRNAYGLNFAAYEILLKKQKGKCAICGAKPKKRLCVDHCHRTKKVRGLLCRNCNAGIGLLKDDPKLLLKAVKYLQRALLNALKEAYT